MKPFDTTTPEGRSLDRYRRILLTSAANLGSRVIGAVVSLAVLPIVLAYLGTERFGLWGEITSMVAWVGLFDLGLASGLVNAVSEAHGRDDRVAAREYVSTALAMLLVTAVALAGAVAVSFRFVAWDTLLAAQGHVPSDTVRWTVAVALGLVIASLPLSIVHQVYAGYQKSYVSTAFDLVGHVLVLVGCIGVVRLRGSMPVLVLAFGGAGFAASVVNMTWLVGREMPWLRPSLRCVSRRAFRRVTASSVPLFLFQFGALLVNQTQNLVLAHGAGLRAVADYTLLWRVYLIWMSVITMSTNSFAPTFRESIERGEAAWAQRTFRHFLKLRMALAAAGCAVFLVGGNLALRLWLRREDVQFDLPVWIALCVTCLSAVWGTTFADLLNIMDRIWPQLWLVLLNGIVTVVLTYALGLRWGVLGAVVAVGTTATLVSSWILPRMARRVFEANVAGATAGPHGVAR